MNQDLYLVGIILVFLLIHIGLAALIANMARNRGRSWAAFFFLSVFFTPVLMWIIAATISPLPGSPKYQAHGIDLGSTNSNGDVAGQIEKLAGLLQSGHLTTEEFETKKKELLSRM
jgi:hypothetical protein